MRRKDEFLGRLAHDLRNPVAAISGALHLARRATSPEDVAWAEDAMDRQLGHLVRQLDDLLDLSRIARGKIGLQRQRLDAAAAARAAAAAVAPPDRRARSPAHRSPRPRARSRSTPTRRGWSRSSSACSATPPGPPTPGGRIRISVAREQDAVVFRVRDDGKEVPPRCPRACDFARDRRPIGGRAGHRADRWSASSPSCTAAPPPSASEGPGEASEFTVRLPAAPDPPAPRAEPEPRRAPAGRGRHAHPRRRRQRRRRPGHGPAAPARRPRRPGRPRRPPGPRDRPRLPPPIRAPRHRAARHGRLRGRPPAPRRPPPSRRGHHRHLRLQPGRLSPAPRRRDSTITWSSRSTTTPCGPSSTVRPRRELDSHGLQSQTDRYRRPSVDPPPDRPAEDGRRV